DYGARAWAFGAGDPKTPARPGPRRGAALSRGEPAEFGEPVHGGAGSDHQRRFLVRHCIGDGNEGVDVVDLVFAKPAVGGEAVGPVTLVHGSVIESVVMAGGVHALPAALALAAAGMNLDRDALADPIFVDCGPERDHGTHVFVSRREVLIVRHAAADQRGRSVIDDLEIG